MSGHHEWKLLGIELYQQIYGRLWHNQVASTSTINYIRLVKKVFGFDLFWQKLISLDMHPTLRPLCFRLLALDWYIIVEFLNWCKLFAVCSIWLVEFDRTRTRWITVTMIKWDTWQVYVLKLNYVYDLSVSTRLQEF